MKFNAINQKSLSIDLAASHSISQSNWTKNKSINHFLKLFEAKVIYLTGKKI
jgi:hypothetical protein